MFPFKPLITYDPSETSGGGGQPGPAPWSQDLASRFEDEGVRTQVDAYLRESWQPRMTQLEQTLSQRPDLPKEAADLWNDLMNDRDNTLAAVVAEVYGDDVAEKFTGLLTPQEAADAANAATQAADAVRSGKLSIDDLPEEVQEVVMEALQTKQAAQYETQVKAAMEQLDGVTVADDYDYVHPFIQANGGRLDLALPAYIAYRDALRGGASQQQAQEAAEEVTADETTSTGNAPAVLGTNGSAPNGTPPTEKKYSWNELEQATRDWLADERKAAPPVVGTV